MKCPLFIFIYCIVLTDNSYAQVGQKEIPDNHIALAPLFRNRITDGEAVLSGSLQSYMLTLKLRI